MNPVSLTKLERAVAPEKIARRAASLVGFDQSLMPPTGLAVLTEIIVEFQPRLVLEIGTYFGGGSEILARALDEADSGLLITIDSNDSRAPEVERRMEEWDEDIRKRVTFLPHSSKDFFESLKGKWEPSIDIAIVDGDHTYLGAYSDIVMCAQKISGGGMIIVDDFNQATVNQAVADFVQTHPDWYFVGDIQRSFLGCGNDAPQPSIEGTPFFVLLAPPDRGFSRHPTLIDHGALAISSLSGAEISLAPHNCTGRLRGAFSIEMVDDDRGMVFSSAGTVFSAIHPETKTVRLELDPPLAVEGRQILRCVTDYTWLGDDDSPHLPLSREPQLIATPL